MTSRARTETEYQALPYWDRVRYRWWADLTWKSGNTYRWWFSSPDERAALKRVFENFATATREGEV